MVHVRSAKGSRKPYGTKKSGYALYSGNTRVRPYFANWFPIKAKAEKKARQINKGPHSQAHRTKKKKRRK